MQRRHSYTFCNDHRQPYRLLMGRPKRIFFFTAKSCSYANYYQYLLINSEQCRLFPKYSFSYYCKCKPNAECCAHKQQPYLCGNGNADCNARRWCYYLRMDRPKRLFIIGSESGYYANSDWCVFVNGGQRRGIRLQPKYGIHHHSDGEHHCGRCAYRTTHMSGRYRIFDGQSERHCNYVYLEWPCGIFIFFTKPDVHSDGHRYRNLFACS